MTLTGRLGGDIASFGRSSYSRLIRASSGQVVDRIGNTSLVLRFDRYRAGEPVAAVVNRYVWVDPQSLHVDRAQVHSLRLTWDAVDVGQAKASVKRWRFQRVRSMWLP